MPLLTPQNAPRETKNTPKVAVITSRFNIGNSGIVKSEEV